MRTASTQSVDTKPTGSRRASVTEDVSTSDQQFFVDLCQQIAVEAGTKSTTILESIDFPTTRVAVLACVQPNHLHTESVINISGRPCQRVYSNPDHVTMIAESVHRQFPEDETLALLCAECYLGFPIRGMDGKVLGMVQLIDDQPRFEEIRSDRLSFLFDRLQLELDKRHFAKSRMTFLESIESISRKAMLSDIVSKMAYELNQPLTVIEHLAHYARLSCDQLSNHKDPELFEIARSLDEISNEVQRAGIELKNIRDLSQKHEQLVQAHEIQDIVSDLVSLVEIECRKNEIQMEIKIQPGMPRAYVNRNQLQHALMNLIRNSIDELKSITRDRLGQTSGEANSMTEMASEELREKHLSNTGRQHTIAIECSSLDNKWNIKVSDSGRGISATEKDRWFRPFESSKSKAMGIGLFVSRLVVESHGGRLETLPGPLEGLNLLMVIPTEQESKPSISNRIG